MFHNQQQNHEARNYFDSLSGSELALYRDIVIALKKAGEISGKFDPETVELHQILSHPNQSDGIRISNIVEGPGTYICDRLWEFDGQVQVPEGMVFCYYDDLAHNEGRTQTSAFKRSEDGNLSLEKSFIHAMS